MRSPGSHLLLGALLGLGALGLACTHGNRAAYPTPDAITFKSIRKWGWRSEQTDSLLVAGTRAWYFGNGYSPRRGSWTSQIAPESLKRLMALAIRSTEVRRAQLRTVQDSTEAACTRSRPPGTQGNPPVPCARGLIEVCEFGPSASYVLIAEGLTRYLSRQCYTRGDDYDQALDSIVLRGRWSPVAER